MPPKKRTANKRSATKSEAPAAEEASHEPPTAVRAKVSQPIDDPVVVAAKGAGRSRRQAKAEPASESEPAPSTAAQRSRQRSGSSAKENAAAKLEVHEEVEPTKKTARKALGWVAVAARGSAGAVDLHEQEPEEQQEVAVVAAKKGKRAVAVAKTSKQPANKKSKVAAKQHTVESEDDGEPEQEPEVLSPKKVSPVKAAPKGRGRAKKVAGRASPKTQETTDDEPEPEIENPSKKGSAVKTAVIHVEQIEETEEKAPDSEDEPADEVGHGLTARKTLPLADSESSADEPEQPVKEAEPEPKKKGKKAVAPRLTARKVIGAAAAKVDEEEEHSADELTEEPQPVAKAQPKGRAKKKGGKSDKKTQETTENDDDETRPAPEAEQPRRTGRAAKAAVKYVEEDVEDSDQGPAVKRGNHMTARKWLPESESNEEEEYSNERQPNKKTKKAAAPRLTARKVIGAVTATVDEEEEHSADELTEEPQPVAKGAAKGRGKAAKPEAKPAVKKGKSKEDPFEAEYVPKTLAACADPPTLSILSWNVNGLRALVGHGGLEFIGSSGADIVVLQETKLGDENVPDEARQLGDYTSHWQSSDGKKGYAGVGLYTKEKPIQVTFGMGIAKHDDEGRLVTTEYEEFYLVGAYVPNSGQGLKRLAYRTEEWDKDFLAYLKKLDANKPVIYTGDLNVAHMPIDLANPTTNRNKTPGFCDGERERFSELLAAGFTDVYRALHPAEEGAYTFWAYRGNGRQKNIGWRLDYFVVSDRLADRVCDVVLHQTVLGSDHCPIELKLAL